MSPTGSEASALPKPSRGRRQRPCRRPVSRRRCLRRDRRREWLLTDGGGAAASRVGIGRRSSPRARSRGWLLHVRGRVPWREGERERAQAWIRQASSQPGPGEESAEPRSGQVRQGIAWMHDDFQVKGRTMAPRSSRSSSTAQTRVNISARHRDLGTFSSETREAAGLRLM